jgi:MafB19-like deaminase
MPGPEHPRNRWSRWLWEVFDALRKQYGLDDLLGDKEGNVVAWTEVNGKEVIGVNSESREYTSVDSAAARRLRAILIEKHPDVMQTMDVGRYPNAAVYHAEVTALLRARAENGGTLAGQTLTVFVDAKICPSCRLVLPKIGLELGNPTVTFVPAIGEPRTMRNGEWVRPKASE